MAELNIMPLYTDAWSGDVSDLPNALYGAYTRLIVRWWREGALPETNEKKLARWAGMSTADFEDLKEFLEQTEKGWVQRKLMKTYAQQLGKSIKAQISANARHKRCERNEELLKRMSDAYAQRMLSMNHEPTLEDKSSNDKKNKKQKKKNGGDVSRETTDLAYPDDLDCKRAMERLSVKHGATRLKTYFQLADGTAALSRDGDKFIIQSDSAFKAELIDQRLGGDLNTVLGKGAWEIRIARKEAA